MSDNPRRRGRPAMHRDPVFRAAQDDDFEDGTVTAEVAETAELADLPERVEMAMPEPDPEPEPTWEPADTAPHDGRPVRMRYGEDDDTGRIVRWRTARFFHHRRWHNGGSWFPVDSLAPLPAEGPTLWLKPPEMLEVEEDAAA